MGSSVSVLPLARELADAYGMTKADAVTDIVSHAGQLTGRGAFEEVWARSGELTAPAAELIREAFAATETEGAAIPWPR